LNNNKTFLSVISTILLFTITVTAGLLYFVSTIFSQTFAQESEEVFIAPGASDPNNNEGAYVPSEIEVPARTTVTWLNDDFIDHTVTANDYGLFDSGPISPGDKFENKFILTGEFGYHCTIHPFMRGIIIVE
jgi:plastocyanin